MRRIVDIPLHARCEVLRRVADNEGDLSRYAVPDSSMPVMRQMFRSARHAAHLFFRSQLSLKLRGGVRLEFVDSRGRRAESPAEAEARRQRAELGRMVGELAQCLDADPDIRPELRHLAYLETALRQQGLAALQTLPVDVLHKALDQFEGLVSNWAPTGLAMLRSKMAVAVNERSAEETSASVSAPVSRTTV